MEKIVRKRVFIPNIDRYDEHYIAEFLSQSPLGGATKSDEAEELDEDEEETTVNKTTDTYEIFGTLSDPEAAVPDFIKDIFRPTEKKPELYNLIAACDFIVYNIKDDPTLIDDALWLVEKLHENRDRMTTQKIFILISSVLTWAKSPLPDENDPELPFTDEDYPRRKAHENFRDHIKAEKTVVQLGKTDKYKLLTYVIASGVTYGETQNVFHHFFKQAWNNSPYLVVPEDGQNIIPIIHVKDLASIIQMTIELRPTKHYIIAKDESQNTLQEIVKAISKGMTTGKIRFASRDDAFLIDELKQSQMDQLLVNLRMDAAYVKEYGRFRWHCENGLVEDITNQLREYKLARQLIPIRLCILGPPVSGKTTLAQRLCEYYKLHHIHIKGVVDEAIATLKRRVQLVQAAEDNKKPNSRGPSSPLLEEEEEEGGGGDPELLESILQNMEDNNGRLDLDYITEFFQNKLNSQPCQNQGYVIDGYPKTRKQAVALFSAGGGGEGEEEEEEEELHEDEEQKRGESGPSPAEEFAKKYLPAMDKIIDVTEEPGLLPTQPIPTQLPKGLLPNYVFELQATDKFLRDRVMSMPESKVQGTHYDEAGLIRRLAEYRTNQLGANPATPISLSVPGTVSSDMENEQVKSNPLSPLAAASISENSIRAYFDAKGVLQIPINVMTDDSELMEETFKKIVHFIGPPRNYGPTPEEEEAEMRRQEQLRMAREQMEREFINAEIEAEEQARDKRIKEWQTKKDKLDKAEAELLDKEAEPLRVYLRKHVMPVLSQGLRECVRKRPEDPIDFLAEYLFFNNPQMD
ncbi:unnamed protein product [Calicophoron daubneyi]|uniref:Adenylate kinase 7 n=1 Tax=Calicophoron daubneyi TaxID=300641 RepID=A0AAV2U0K1_CALDB